MALTFTTVGAVRMGDSGPIMSQMSITLDASYAAGGIVIDARSLGMHRIYGGHATLNTAAATGPSNGTLIPQGDGSTAKLKLANAGATAELGAGIGSGAILDVLAFGE